MRGLGIGILITTIVLSFNNKIQKLSDKEILAKARELGMIMKEEETDDNLEKVLGKSLDKEKSEHEQDATENENDTSNQGIDQEYNDIDTEDPVVEGNDIDINEPVEGNDIDTQDPIVEDNNTDIDEVTFDIVRGMSSYQVSELLYEKGLIDEVEGFNAYIKQKGKAGVIRIGSYSLSKEATYQEILKAIVE